MEGLAHLLNCVVVLQDGLEMTVAKVYYRSTGLYKKCEAWYTLYSYIHIL